MGAFKGIKILDFSVGQAGPGSCSMFAELGAEVIKIEDTTSGDFGRLIDAQFSPLSKKDTNVNVYVHSHNRGKKAIAVDMKQPEGKEVILKLIKDADVLVQGFRPGVMEKLGLGYAELSKLNPRLIYVSLSGLGTKGPWAELPGLDLVGQATSGLLNLMDTPNDPLNWFRIPIVDQASGVYMSFGIATALYNRERTGAGQEVELSLLSSALYFQAWYANLALIRGVYMEGADRSTSAPTWNCYRCKDGKTIIMCCHPSDRYWPGICKSIEREDLIDDPLFDTHIKRVTYAKELLVIVDDAFSQRTRDEWFDILTKHDIICAKVSSYEELETLPQAVINDYIVEYDNPKGGKITSVGLPFKLSKTPGNPCLVAPEWGEHTVEVLSSLGYTQEKLEAMKQQKIIRQF